MSISLEESSWCMVRKEIAAIEMLLAYILLNIFISILFLHKMGKHYTILFS